MSDKTDWQWVAQNPKEAADLIDQLNRRYEVTVEDFNSLSDETWRLKQLWMQVETLAFELCQIDDSENLHKLHDLITSVHRKPTKLV
jgi:ABC-type nitrate/sulfonate/bicarbonate transport system substrate-binding protein